MELMFNADDDWKMGYLTELNEIIQWKSNLEVEFIGKFVNQTIFLSFILYWKIVQWSPGLYVCWWTGNASKLHDFLLCFLLLVSKSKNHLPS